MNKTKIMIEKQEIDKAIDRVEDRIGADIDDNTQGWKFYFIQELKEEINKIKVFPKLST